MPVQFKCDCSHERFKEGLAAIGKDELEAMISEDHGAEVVCQFCGEAYHYSENELEALVVDAQK